MAEQIAFTNILLDATTSLTFDDVLLDASSFFRKGNLQFLLEHNVLTFGALLDLYIETNGDILNRYVDAPKFIMSDIREYILVSLNTLKIDELRSIRKTNLAPSVELPKRSPGRPKKILTPEEEELLAHQEPKKVGRPAKPVDPNKPKRKRGRPRKDEQGTPSVVRIEQPKPRKRRRRSQPKNPIILEDPNQVSSVFVRNEKYDRFPAVYLFKKIPESMYAEPLDMLAFYGYAEKHIDFFREKGYQKIGDLLEFTTSNFTCNFILTHYRLKIFLERGSHTLEELFYNDLICVDDPISLYMIHKRMEGYTYTKIEELARKYRLIDPTLTRPSIRYNDVRYVNSLIPVMLEPLKKILVTEDKPYFRQADLEAFFQKWNISMECLPYLLFAFQGLSFFKPEYGVYYLPTLKIFIDSTVYDEGAEGMAALEIIQFAKKYKDIEQNWTFLKSILDERNLSFITLDDAKTLLEAKKSLL